MTPDLLVSAAAATPPTDLLAVAAWLRAPGEEVALVVIEDEGDPATVGLAISSLARCGGWRNQVEHGRKFAEVVRSSDERALRAVRRASPARLFFGVSAERVEAWKRARAQRRLDTLAVLDQLAAAPLPTEADIDAADRKATIRVDDPHARPRRFEGRGAAHGYLDARTWNVWEDGAIWAYSVRQAGATTKGSAISRHHALLEVARLLDAAVDGALEGAG